MTKNNFTKIIVIIGALLAVELVSYAGFTWPILNTLAFALIILAVLILSAYRLEYGLLAIIAELLIGSLGHLFYLSWGDNRLAIRIGLWLIVMGVFAVKFLIQLMKSGRAGAYWQKIKDFAWRRNFAWLGLFILIGLGNGLLRHHDLSTILVDFNSWLYFLLLFPVIVVYGQADEKALQRLKEVFLAGAIFLSLKTLILLYIFTHNSGLAPEVYTWLRRNLLGEMTPTKTGWPRIFLQSQIFSALAFFLIFWLNQAKFTWKNIFRDNNWLPLVLAGSFLSAVLLSFSRSFWVGLLAAGLASLIVIWRLFSWRKMISAGFWMLAAGAISFLIVYLVVAFPYWRPSSGNLSATLLARVSDSNEAALASRWSLLPVLVEKIKQSPAIGQGYGATVTYFSRDPRILENNPSGEYTTYIFEWSYLDLWLKLGAVGLLIYLWLLFRISGRLSETA